MANVNILSFFAVLLSVLALVFAILAITLNWQYAETDGVVKLTAGLWDYCFEVNLVETCTDIEADDSRIADSRHKHYKATRAMIIIGVILTAVSMAVGIAAMFVPKDLKILYFVAAGIDIAAGLFLMIGMAVFLDKLEEDGYDNHRYEVGFAFEITAWIVAWIGGGLFIGAKLFEKE